MTNQNANLLNSGELYDAEEPFKSRKDIKNSNKIQEISNAAYEEYLTLLQERNRLLRKLKRKNKKQVALEKREQGFLLYLNGANADIDKNHQKYKNNQHHKGYHQNKNVLHHGSHHSSLQGVYGKRSRKNWLKSSMCIKTKDGVVWIGTPDDNIYPINSNHKDKFSNKGESENLSKTERYKPEKKRHHRSLSNRLSQCEKALNNVKENLSIQEKYSYPVNSSLVQTSCLSSLHNLQGLRILPNELTVIKNSVNEVLEPSKMDRTIRNVDDDIVELSSASEKKTKRVLSATLQKESNKSDDNAVVPKVLEAIEAENRSLSFDAKIQSIQVSQVDPATLSTKSEISSTKWTKVCFEIYSNWGNPSRLGLTEVQFFDEKKHKMKVLPEVSEITDAFNAKGGIAELCNGKYKTVKERYMWSCALTNKPVKLMFAVDVPEASIISAIKIWNYNRGIKELNIGARFVRIFVAEELKYEGCLDKGCGNQVFDYSQTISLYEFPLPFKQEEEVFPEKASPEKTSNLSCPSSLCSLRNNEPDLKSSVSTDIQQRLSLLQMLASTQDPNSPTKSKSKVNMPSLSELSLQDNTSSKRKLSEENKSGNIQDSSESPVPRPSSWLSSLPNIPNEVNSDLNSETSGQPPQDERWDPNFKVSLPDKSSSPSKTVHYSQKQPIQKSETRGMSSTGERPSWLSGVDIDISEPFENPLLSPSSLRGTSAKRFPSGRPRRYDSEPFLDMYCTKLNSNANQKQSDELEEVSLDGIRTPREGSAKYGRRAIPSPIPSSGDIKRSQKFIQNVERQFSEDSPLRKPYHSSESTLEESWTSLHMFDQCHRGRISTEAEGDVLDMYISIDKPLKNHMFLQSTSSEDDTVSVGSTDSDFIIPELPEGREMVVNIRTTWGDFHYVGLNGIEIFSSNGEHVKVEKICANPADINILPEYSKDPRVVTNLIDGVYRTRDDMHLWLTPFTPGQDHLIILTFEKSVKVAMIRIWNYNKSRIHSFRGAKDIEIILDGHCIFKGEIARACGGIQGGTEAFGDTILFTTDDDILEAIAHHDETFTGFATESSEFIRDDHDLERPRTGYQNSEMSERPLTTAQTFQRKHSIIDWDDSSKLDYMNESVDNLEEGVFCGQMLTLNLLCNWGDPDMIGLTGLEVLDEFGDPVPLKPFMLDTNLDVQWKETIPKIIDGIHLTFSEAHMWVIPFRESHDHKIVVTFPQPIRISGIRLWNYNLSLEDSYRGVKVMHITLDNKILSPANGFLTRKGPGTCHFDFAQEILFKGAPSYSLLLPKVSNTSERSPTPLDETIIQDYVAPVMPRGFIFQLHLFSSWGDPYYIGLNGLEVYDALGNKIPLTENNIAAYPDSVNVLDGIDNDVRTPDKLIDGINDTIDGRHMWLAPILPKVLNRVYIIFDFPVTLSMLKLWNYAKTPARGVKEFGLLVDDLLVYSNILAKASHTVSGSSNSSVHYHTILFTTDREITQKEEQSVLRNLNLSQDVQLTNDCQVLHRCASGKVIDQAMRPFTSLPPKTAERSLKH